MDEFTVTLHGALRERFEVWLSREGFVMKPLPSEYEGIDPGHIVVPGPERVAYALYIRQMQQAMLDSGIKP